MKKILCFSLFAILLLTFSGKAFADPSGPRLSSKHNDWAVYVYEDNGHKVCFMTSQPTKSAGKYTKRGEIHTFVTHWTEDGSKNVFNIIAGYPIKTGSVVAVTIDSKKFSLPTIKGETAWASDQATDNALADALQRGSKMVVKGTSQRGTLTTDTYSLRGTTAAYKALNAACKM